MLVLSFFLTLDVLLRVFVKGYLAAFSTKVVGVAPSYSEVAAAVLGSIIISQTRSFTFSMILCSFPVNVRNR